MSRNQIACCPSCGAKIPFVKFVQLNNFSITNCVQCNARIEISNRSANILIAGGCGIVSAASIVIATYIGENEFQSFLGGLLFGVLIAMVVIVCLCRYAHRHAQLNRIKFE